jgi:hypothetical protein
MTECSTISIDDIEPNPADHLPDRFEERFGIIGKLYNSPEGLRRVSNGKFVGQVSAVDAPVILDRRARILEFLSGGGWHTKTAISSGAGIQFQAGLREVDQLYKEGLVCRADSGKAQYYFMEGEPMPDDIVRYRKYGDE